MCTYLLCEKCGITWDEERGDGAGAESWTAGWKVWLAWSNLPTFPCSLFHSTTGSLSLITTRRSGVQNYFIFVLRPKYFVTRHKWYTMNSYRLKENCLVVLSYPIKKYFLNQLNLTWNIWLDLVTTNPSNPGDCGDTIVSHIVQYALWAWKKSGGSLR